jgi:hypothetical protein
MDGFTVRSKKIKLSEQMMGGRDFLCLPPDNFACDIACVTYIMNLHG